MMTTLARVGRCRPSDSLVLHAAVGDARTNRIYDVAGDFTGLGVTAIVACDRTTFTEVGRITFPEIRGNITLVAIRPGVGFVVLVRRDDVAELPGQIVFIDTNLVVR